MEKDEEDEQFYIDTLYIERFYIELNDPISCRVSLASQKLFCPNYPFQPVCFTSLQSLIIPTATSQSAQCYISKIEPLICPQQHRRLKNRAGNESEKVRQRKGEGGGRKVFYISLDVASCVEYIDRVTLQFFGEKLNSRPHQGFDASQT